MAVAESLGGRGYETQHGTECVSNALARHRRQSTSCACVCTPSPCAFKRCGSKNGRDGTRCGHTHTTTAHTCVGLQLRAFFRSEYYFDQSDRKQSTRVIVVYIHESRCALVIHVSGPAAAAAAALYTIQRRRCFTCICSLLAIKGDSESLRETRRGSPPQPSLSAPRVSGSGRGR